MHTTLIVNDAELDMLSHGLQSFIMRNARLMDKWEYELSLKLHDTLQEKIEENYNVRLDRARNE